VYVKTAAQWRGSRQLCRNGSWVCRVPTGTNKCCETPTGMEKNMREFHRNEDAFMITLPLLRLQRPKNCQQPASNQIPTISKAPVSISCNYQQYIPVLIIMWITWHGKNFRRDGPGWKLGWNCGIGRDKNKKKFFRMGVFCVTMQRHGTTSQSCYWCWERHQEQNFSHSPEVPLSCTHAQSLKQGSVTTFDFCSTGLPPPEISPF